MSAQIFSFALAAARKMSGQAVRPAWEPKVGDRVRATMPGTGERITTTVRLVLLPDINHLRHRVMCDTRFGPRWCKDPEPLS